MNVVAIVQARMGSSRLPGKVLMKIEGKPMLWHVVKRLSSCKLINKIVVATSIKKNDDAIENFCNLNNILCFRGSEKDVLDRYYKSAVAFNADIIIRITSDCPLIDPQVIDSLIYNFLMNKDDLDGASNVIERTYPRGLDVELITYKTLERIWLIAQKEYQREHVTKYIYDNLFDFKIFSLKYKKDFSYLRLTVDTEEDLELIKKIYKGLYKKDSLFLFADIIKFLEKNKSLALINSHVMQKKCC